MKNSSETLNKKITQGQTLFKTGKVEESKILFLKLLENNPLNTEILNNLGVIFFSKGDIQKAEKFFKKAINVDNNHTDSRLNIINLLQGSGRYEESINHLKFLIQSRTDDVNIINQLAMAYLETGKKDEAISSLVKSLNINPAQKIVKESLSLLNASSPRIDSNITIKIISPSDFDNNPSRRILWGDHWVKFELEQAFSHFGLKVVNGKADVVIYLFGSPIEGLTKDSFNMVWLYSHPDMVTSSNLKVFDKIFCLSSSFIPNLKAMGYKDIDLMIGATSKTPIYLPQKYDVVFVGNTRAYGGRKIISDIGDIPFNFKVWGNGWDKILPKKNIGGLYYDNQKLNELYASSVISINDHHPDMAKKGMVAVKIFDILASGGFALSDTNTGIHDIFGDAVPQYSDAEDLRDIISYYLKNPDIRYEMTKKGREIALAHTFKDRALQFLSAIPEDIKSAKKKEKIYTIPKVNGESNSENNRLKILYVDTISAAHATCNVNGMLKSYRKIADVTSFDYRGLAAQYGVEFMNKMLIEKALKIKPDMIHLGKCESIAGMTVKIIKENIETCIVHFYGDFRWNPQPWVVDIGKHTDFTLFSLTDERILQKYRNAGVQNIAGWWDAGSDPNIFYPRNVEQDQDVVFMGNNLDIPHDGYPKRRQLIEELLKNKLDVHLYGKEWDYLLQKGYQTLYIHPFATEEEFATVCSRSKIVLGINGVNDVRMYASWRRAVNTMASGAFHLTHYVPGMESIFQNKEHLVWFNSVPEAIELVYYYLTHNDEREAISRKGRNEVLKNHTWDARIKIMLNLYSQYAEYRKSIETPIKNRHLI